METENTSDMALIQRCLGGDEEAFGVIYERYRRQLFSYILKILDNQRDQAEDVFQQVWVKAVANWRRYDDRQRLLAWLCRIAHNLIMDIYRRQSRAPMMPLEDWDGPTEALPLDEERQRTLMLSALEAAIVKLPEEQRQVVAYRRSGKSFKEIAELQHSTLNTVLGRMHYAVLKLRDALRDYI